MDKRLRRFIYFVGCGVVLLAFGCVNLQEIGNSLSEEGDYHFRKTRWGYSQAMVELSEQKQGSRLFFRKENVLIYNERIADIPLKLVYSFEDDRLRAAGYLTENPIKNTKMIYEYVRETLGDPNDRISGGSVWADYETLIYLNGYLGFEIRSDPGHVKSPGLLERIPQKPREGTAGTISFRHVVWTYVDQNFFRQLHEVEDPLAELSYYDKRLLDVLRKPAMTKYLGVGGGITLPK